MDTLINFLMFALPGGFVGSIFTWLFGRRKRDNDMLSQLQASINLLSEENRKILEENVQLRRENADLKANQEEMILKLSCLTKEVERLRKVISKQSVNDERQNPGVDPRNPIIARRVPAGRMRHVQREPGPSETGHGADGENDRQRRRVRGRGITAARKMQELLADRRSLTLMQEPVPAQEAALTIPFQNLLDLPEGAGYRHRDGRASVDIRRQGDSLTVTGHCDSLMRRCLFYEEEVFRRQVREDSLLQTVEFYKRELVRIRNETEQDITEIKTEFKQRFSPVKIALIAFIAGVASGILSTFLKKRRLYE